jgi:hypothetical protein
VTDVPAGPDVGLTVIFGTTVKIVVPVPEFPSVPVNICPPTVVAGTVYVHEKFPPTLVTAVQAVPWLQLTVTEELFP